MTPKAVADRARGMGTVFVHRCGHGTEPPAIVCEARVRSTDAVGRDVLVRLEPVRTMAVVPSVTPGPGTNCYTAPEPR